jgi:hypothetical protein
MSPTFKLYSIFILQEKYDASDENRELKLRTINCLERYFYLGKPFTKLYIQNGAAT